MCFDLFSQNCGLQLCLRFFVFDLFRAANPSKDLRVIKYYSECKIWIINVMHAASLICASFFVLSFLFLFWLLVCNSQFLFNSTSFRISWQHARGLKRQWPHECGNMLLLFKKQNNFPWYLDNPSLPMCCYLPSHQ